MLTEDEARTKWCPFSRYSGFEGEPASNRWKQCAPEDQPHALNPVPCRCIASECAAWQWDKGDVLKPCRVHPNSLDDYWHGWTVTDPVRDKNGYVEISPPEHVLRGYCGLAGA